MQNFGGTPFNPLAGFLSSVSFGLDIYELFMFFLVYRLVKSYRSARALRRAEWVREVSEPPFPRPALYSETDDTLHSLGIVPLTIVLVKFRGADPIYSWVYRSEDAKIWVELVFNLPTPVLVGFSSIFSDDAMIMTRYPFGEVITTPMHHANFARRSLISAYHHHQQTVTDWREVHGDPLSVESLSDITRFEAVYYQKYQYQDYERIRRVTRQSLIYAVVLLIANRLGTAAFKGENLVLAGLALIAICLLTVRLYILLRSLTHPPNALDDPAAATN